MLTDISSAHESSYIFFLYAYGKAVEKNIKSDVFLPNKLVQSQTSC